MGKLRQLASLFWKNYVIRKRHPAILVFEILWPVLLFVLVGILRTGIPPTSKDTCSYPERGLPGNDLVPFLQSSVCNLNNNCKDPKNISMDAANQQRFQAMVADIGPILTKNTTLNAVKALPIVQKVLQIARNITSGTDLDKLDDRLKLRNLFSDPDELIALLTDKYKVLTRKAANDLLDSSINIVPLVQSFGSLDFEGIVCDSAKLEKYIVFPKDVDVSQVSKELCAINSNLVSNITNELVRMLDVPNMIRLAEDFSNLMGEFDYAVLFEDLANMVELLQGRSSLASLFTDVSFLTTLPTAFRDIGKLIPILSNMKDIDFTSLEALYDILKPMLRSLTVNDEMIGTIDELLEAGNTVIQALADPNADWSKIIQDLLPLLNNTDVLIQDNNEITEILSIVPQISGYLDLLMGNDTISSDSVLSSVGQSDLDGMMKMIMGDGMMDSMMIVSYGVMDMADEMMDFFKDMDDSLRYSVETNSDIGDAMVTLNGLGPATTGEFLTEVLSVENVRNIYYGTRDVQTVCMEAASNVFSYLPEDQLTGVRGSVCSTAATQVVQSSMSSEKYTQLQASMRTMMEEMDGMLNGSVPLRENMTMERMTERMTETITVVTNMVANMTRNWDGTLLKVVPAEEMVYEYEWRQMWMDLSGTYMKSNLLAQLETTLKTMEKTSLWMSVDSGFLMADALMAALRKSMGVVGSLAGPDGTLYTFAAHLQYIPEVVQRLMQNTDVVSKIYEIENMENISAIVDVVCKLNWSELNVSSNVPIGNVENLVCNTNWTAFMETMFVSLHPFSLLKEVEDRFMDGHLNGINWSKMLDNLDYHLSLITNGVVMEYVTLWMDALGTLDVGAMFGSVEKLLGDMMGMGAGETVTSNKDIIIQGLQILDGQLGEMEFWTQAQHYITVVVAYHKVINKYLAAARVSGFNATLYINDVSPTLGEFLQHSASSVPELLDGIQYAMSNIYNTLNTFMVADFMDLCNSLDINELLQLPNNDNVAKFKEELCALNWTQIGEELMGNDDNLQQLFIELDRLNSGMPLQPIKVNWTDIVSTVEEFITLMESTVTEEQTFMWDALDLDSVNGSYTSLANGVWNLPEYDVNWQIQAMNRLFELLYQQDDPMMEGLKISIAMQTYFNYQINVFLNMQLKYFTTRSVVDLRTYVKSAEMDKVFDVLVDTPDIIRILHVNLMKISKDMDTTSLTALGQLPDICNKENTLSSIDIPADVNMTAGELQTLVCGLDLNGTKLMEELLQGLAGLDELIDSIEFFNKVNLTSSDLYVNKSTVDAASNMTAELLEKLINSPPTITIGTTNLVNWVGDVINELVVSMEELSLVNTSAESLLGSLAASQQQLSSLYMSLMMSGGDEMNGVLRVMDMYTLVLEHMLKDVEGFLTDPEAGFKDYPEMKKLWQLLEQAPYLMQTYIYTSVNDVPKVTTFTSRLAEGIDSLCAATPSELMEVPPGIPFDFTAFMNLFCSINMTSFEGEYMRFSKAENITAAYDSLQTNDSTSVDMAALTERIQSLISSATEMATQGERYHLPQFLNETVWLWSVRNLTRYLDTNLTWIDLLLEAQQQSFTATLNTLNEQGGMNGILKVAQLYMTLIDKMISEGSELMSAADMGLSDYPEMRKIWELMEDLPDVMETFIYTSYMDNLKLSRVTELIVEGMDKLCEANPEDLMTVPPGSMFDFSAFFNKFCTLNMTELEEEYSNFTNREEIAHVWANIMSYNDTVNVTSLMETSQSIMSRFEDLMNSTIDNIPRFLDGHEWDKAFETIMGFYANNTDWIRALTATSGFEMINDTDVYRVALTVDMGLDLMIDRLTDISVNLTVESLTRDAPNLVMMIKSMAFLNQELANTTLENNIDTEKLMSLAMDPAIMMEFCTNESLATYIRRDGSPLDIAENLQNILCVVMDTDSLVASLQDQVDYTSMEEQLMAIWNMSNTELTYDWDQMTIKMTTVIDLLTKMTSSQLHIDPVLSELLEMDSILNMLSELASSPALYAALSNTLSPLVGNQPIDASGISAVVMYMIELFEQNDWSVPVTALLPDSSAMATYIEELLSADSYQTMMLATLQPEQFWMLILSGDWESTVCNSTKFTMTFTFPEGLDVGQLQRDLCDKSKSQNLNGVFRSIDVADITNQLGQFVANLTSQSGVVDAPMTIQSLANYASTILQQLTNGGNGKPFNLEEYLGPITDALNNLNPSSTNIMSVCKEITGYFGGTEAYQSILDEYLHTVYLSLEVSRVYFSIQDELGDVLCDADFRNVSGLVQKMKEREIPEKLQYLADVYTGKHNTADAKFTCEGLGALYDNFTDLTTSSIDTFGGLLNESSRTLACVNSTWTTVQDLLFDMARLVSEGAQIVNILKDLEFQRFIFTITESNQTLNLLNQIVTLYRDQEKSIQAIQDALQSNVTDLLTLLENNYNIAPDSLTTFVNSVFNQDFVNMTSEETLDYICTSSTLEEAIQLDPSFFDLRSQLCGEDRETALALLESLRTLQGTLDKLTNAGSSSSFQEILTSDLTELFNNIEGISELANIFEGLDGVDITNLQVDNELLDTVQRLLVDTNLDSLYESLSAVIGNFADVGGDDSLAIVSELQAVTKGVFAFNSIRSMFVRDVKIASLVKDPALLTKYMQDELGLSMPVAQAITDGSISFKILLEASEMNVTAWVCNSTQLAELINLAENAGSSSPTDADYLSTQFCALDSETIEKILKEVLLLVDVGDLMQELIENSFHGMLAKENVTIDETKASLDNVQLAQTDFKTLMEIADEYTSQLPVAVASLTSAQLGASDSITSLSAFVCGSDVEDVGDQFGLGSSIKSVDELNEKQLEEMNSLPGQYCKDMYLEIMSTEYGPIIWTYMKPLLRGKILYSPNTEAMAMVMRRMNSTFTMIEDMVVQARDWAKGSSVFEELSGEKGASLKEILDSQLVGGVITEVTGMGVKDITNLMDSLNGTDPELLKGLSSLTKLVGDYVDCIELDRFVGFESEEALNAEAARLHSSNNLLAGVVFDLGDSDNRKKREATSNLPRHVKYSIRMDIDNVQHTYRLKERMWRPKPEDGLSSDLRYLRGFIQLQHMIDSALISAQMGSDLELPPVAIKQFPFPCHEEDTFINAFAAYLLPILMTIAWLAGISVAVYNLVYDRENGQEETLKAIGLTSSLNWWAWFISTMLICSVIAFINAVIMKYWNVFTHSDLLLMFLFFLEFVFSAIMLCYFVSAFFTRTALAILASLIVYFVSYLPYVVLIALELDMEFWQKFLACLSSTTAFSFGCHFIARFEEQQIGVQWDNAGQSPLHDDNFSFEWACIMMAIDGAIYLILGWYVRNVKPGKFGVAQPWYFPLCPSYWCGCGDKTSSSRYIQSDVLSEEMNTDLPVVISLRGLSKTFSGQKAVDNLSLDIHAGHVTALLGHNGAAKTTTMNMLIGVLEPSAGEVRIFNRPQNKMRKSIGICPQHNALFEYMTVEEHMEFYASIKSGNVDKNEIKELLKDIDLWHNRYTRVKELSGGMQRRLCVALAFVGGSKAVILDEPTSGVDPSGRRAIWNLIIKKKLAKDNKGAAILLSTHHLDEADILGDRIGIMHEGKLLCNGSPMFLKHHLTDGHRLTVVKGSTDNDPSAILSRLQAFVPMTRLQQVVGPEITFVLPSTNSQNFYKMLKDLEMYKENLNIESYGVSDPTLEEVFLKVCKTADMKQKITPDNVRQVNVKDTAEPSKEWKHTMESEVERNQHIRKVQRISGGSLKFQQFGALLTKRFNHFRRNWRVFFSVLILPLLLFLLATGFYHIKPKGIEAPSILLTPATYGPDTYVFYKGSRHTPLSGSIIDSFEQKPGIGTSCMPGSIAEGAQYKCLDEQFPYTGMSGVPDNNRTCICTKEHKFECQGFITPPRSMVTTTTDILQDLNDRDTEEYLIESFHDFIEKRYGGWSFDKDDEQKLHATIWFNNKGHHALPSFLNAYSNGLLRALVNESHGNPAEFGITASTHPYLFSQEQLDENTLLQNAADAGIALTVLLAFTFFPCGVMMYVVMENLNKDKHLQSISGVGPLMYWLAAILWDLLILIVAVGVTFGIIAIFQMDSFWNRENAPATLVLLFLYGWSTIPLTYCLVKLFKSVSSAFFTVFCTMNFLGISTVSTMFVMTYFSQNYNDNSNFKEDLDIARKVLLVIPQYALTGGLLELIANEIKTTIFAKFNADVYVNPFTFDMVLWNMIVMAIEGLVFFIIAILLEMRCNSCSSTFQSRPSDDVYDDIDVQREKRRIQQGQCPNDILVVRDLQKIYPGRDVYAVSGLTFGVPGGECFGLLGVNGAGKTTTFKMLTGAIEATHGEAWLLGKSVKNASTFGKTVGYCPQEEALDVYLTVEETLAFHCKLKGIPGKQHNMAIQNVMTKLGLNSYKDKTVKSCSGGMKRKISLAVALLGDPPIVLLDEPTTGMDPKAKRLVWDCLLDAKKNGQAIVLTSHSLEECDILCDRIAIMVNGDFKCLGSSQHLKDKFGEGYTVTLNVSGLSTKISSIQELVQEHFPGASIRDHHENVIQLDIPKHSTNVSDIFGVLETEKGRYNISYYTVSQTTLDTVFLNFARDQGEPSTPDCDTGSSSIESESEGLSTNASLIPTAYHAYHNKMYDTMGDSEPKFKRSLFDERYIMPEDGGYSTKM